MQQVKGVWNSSMGLLDEHILWMCGDLREILTHFIDLPPNSQADRIVCFGLWIYCTR